MMTFDDLGQLLARHSDEDDSFREAYEGISLGTVQPLNVQPGKGRASTLLSIWKIREWTTRRAGISRLGFETALHNLVSRPPDEELLVWPLKGRGKFYVVFVAEREGAEEVKRTLVGCIRVTERPRTPLDELMKFLQDQNREHHWQAHEEERCVFVLCQLLVLKLVRAVGSNPTMASASEALRLCEQQQRTAQENGIPTMGFERTLQRLGESARDESLIQWSFEALPGYSGEGSNILFTLFISESRQEVVGCTGVERR